MSEISATVDSWLEPLGDNPCGEDLEYDNAFLELTKAAEGKPETQFSEAEPPEWRTVSKLAETMMEQTRDIRVCLYWGRAQLHQEGLAALPEIIRLIRCLLVQYWDEVHPQPDPDDGDPYARLNVLAQLEDFSSVLGDVRQSRIFASRAIGQLIVRDVELALDRLSPREDESAMSVSTVEQMLQAAVEDDAEIAAVPSRARSELNELVELLQERVGYGRAPSCDELKAMLSAVEGVMPSEGSSTSDDDFLSSLGDLDTDSEDEELSAPRSVAKSRSRGGLGSIETRADAIKAIEMVCAYLEEAEPTSPAQLLLRRAQRLIDKSFIDLIRELAPEALAEVGKIMGVDTSDSNDSYSSGFSD